ncbi:MAG: NAD(+) diphosphatase [Moraxella sp.]|nr:NAD(+) diphosphatase [Moraxella sp.]
MVSFWIIDGQSVFCQDGFPHRCMVATDDPAPTYRAIDHQTAQALGVDLSKGEFLTYRSLVGTLDTTLALELSGAIQFVHWHKTHQYCTVCGTPTLTPSIPKVCPNCHHHSYPTISPCVIVAITRICPTTQKPQILLARHHRHSAIYTLIAGFVEIGETLEMTVHREVKEEVGVLIDEPIYLGSQAWPYPSNLMVGFLANYQTGDITPQADEIADAHFFDLDNLPKVAPKGTIAHTIIDDVVKRFG